MVDNGDGWKPSFLFEKEGDFRYIEVMKQRMILKPDQIQRMVFPYAKLIRLYHHVLFYGVLNTVFVQKFISTGQ